MKRLATIVALAAAAAALVVLLTGSRSPTGSSGRFDVIFDDARGLVSGQLVKIAGARAGAIENVVVTPDFKARIEATVDRRFMPFHQDATCMIRPQGLIGENYVECDPGTARSPALTGSGREPPTVPVTHTSEPVSLLDLFNTFNLPTRQRLMVMIDELGVATAGRGGDINQILLRANPTLALARQAIAILTRQRTQLQTVVAATHTIMAQGAAHTASLQHFLDQAAALSTTGAEHRGALSQSVNRLPALLAATQPALAQLDALARGGTPLLAQLQATAPSLNRVAADLRPFAAAAKPGLARLATALRGAIPAIRQASPLLETVRAYARRSRGSTELAGRLFANLQRHGFVEGFYSVMYYIAAGLSRFDSTSHMLPLLLVAPQNGTCGNYATAPVAGCSAHYGSQSPYRPARARALSSLAGYLVK